MEHKNTERVNLPIEWHIPENFPTTYASNVFVQPGEYEFSLLFFHHQAPLLMGTPEEKREQLQRIDSIRAECVGRLVVNPELVPKIVESLQASYLNYLEAKQVMKEETGDKQ